MFVFCVVIDSQQTFDRYALKPIAAFGGPDATLITSPDKPVAATYNKMLEATLDMDGVEAVVLMREDVEITDPRFVATVREAFAADPGLAILGPTCLDTGPRRTAPDAPRPPVGTAVPVEAVDDACMVLRGSLAARLRFDEAAFTGDRGADIDFCRRAREEGFTVALADLHVERHAHEADASASVRSAAAVWQGRSATTLGRATLSRLAGVDETWGRPVDGRHDDIPGEAAPTTPEGFFEFAHPEIVEFVGEDVREVLDVCCGTGTLGAAIKEATGARVTGIEFGEAAASVARTRLDEVLLLDVSTAAPLPLPERRFDVIVLADVLERLPDAEGTLAALAPLLAPGGRLIATVPNVKHWSVVLPLLVDDRWQMQASGPQHHGAIRFFTIIEAALALRAAGLGDVEILATARLPLDDPEQLDPLLAALSAYGVDREEAHGLLETSEYLVAARRERGEA